ncbi:MAG: DUF2779 domain-containing protein [Phycisphaerales bacterium]
MAKRMITKEAFLTAMECTTQGWYLLRDKGGTPTPGEQLRMEEGKEVHRRAQSLHPNGVYAGKPARTKQLILDSAIEVIFEAAFEVDGYAARADWIRRTQGGWIIGEIKSSLHDDDGPKDEHIDDLAYTCMVLRRSGLPVKSCELVLMNREWRLGMDDPSLFIVTDITEMVVERTDEFNQAWERFGPLLLRNSRPSPHWCFACRNCDYFEDQCVGVGVRDPIFVLPRLRENKFDELTSRGVFTIQGIPTDFKLSENQAAVARAIRTREPLIDEELIRSSLDELKWPVGYLDFETVKTAIPLYPGVAPHEQVVTQYSLHIQESELADLAHVDYLADHTADCRRELTERLLADTASFGSVVTYSPFEKTTIRGLARLFPGFKDELSALEGMLFDLEPVVRRCVIHPEFKGRSSIKVVLPVLVPELSYTELTVGDGDSAIAAFVGLAIGSISADAIQDTRESLLEYCALDTLAMAKVLRSLQA